MKERKRRSVLQSARADGDGMRRPRYKLRKMKRKELPTPENEGRKEMSVEFSSNKNKRALNREIN